MLNPADLQRQTLRLYGELVSRRANYGGQLVFTRGTGCSATGLPAAVSIAGGTTLALDPDAATVKSVFRQGGIDFVVNTLDEALRVLKNEVRQHKPLSVALIADLQPALAEMRERGVVPDLHLTLDAPSELLFGDPDPAATLIPLARQHLHLTARNGSADPTSHLTAWLATNSWSEHILSSTSETPLRSLDAHLLANLSPADSIRRTWLQRISHYQRPSVGSSRLLWLTAAERDQALSSPSVSA
jgi:hypothetical protein